MTRDEIAKVIGETKALVSEVEVLAKSFYDDKNPSDDAGAASGAPAGGAPSDGAPAGAPPSAAPAPAADPAAAGGAAADPAAGGAANPAAQGADVAGFEQMFASLDAATLQEIIDTAQKALASKGAQAGAPAAAAPAAPAAAAPSAAPAGGDFDKLQKSYFDLAARHERLEKSFVEMAARVTPTSRPAATNRQTVQQVATQDRNASQLQAPTFLAKSEVCDWLLSEQARGNKSVDFELVDLASRVSDSQLGHVYEVARKRGVTIPSKV